eukprot:11475698-Alexandrium_andersonii.AAC.1
MGRNNYTPVEPSWQGQLVDPKPSPNRLCSQQARQAKRPSFSLEIGESRRPPLMQIWVQQAPREVRRPQP